MTTLTQNDRERLMRQGNVAFYAMFVAFVLPFVLLFGYAAGIDHRLEQSCFWLTFLLALILSTACWVIAAGKYRRAKNMDAR